MDRKTKFVILSVIITAIAAVLESTVPLPPFIKDNTWLLLSLLGICLFILIYVGLRESPAQHSGPPNTISPPKHPAKPLSRRTVIAGLAATGAATVGGGITWWEITHQPPHTLYTYGYGGSGTVYTVAWSPDGSNRIASGYEDTTVQVWDAFNGANQFIYRGHSIYKTPDGYTIQYRIYGIAWSPDGKRIASGSEDKTVQVWDAADGGNAFTYRRHFDSVNSVTWSPDGKRIASGSSDDTVQIWNAADGGNVYTYRGHSASVISVAWSPDGQYIASGSADKTVQVWDATDGGKVYTYHGHNGNGGVSAVAWSPDGKRIASAGSSETNMYLQIWDAANGGNVRICSGLSNDVSAVAWSPDGKRIASGSDDGTVQIWNAADGGHIDTYHGYGSSTVYAVTWSPDSKYIALGGDLGTVQVWEAK